MGTCPVCHFEGTPAEMFAHVAAEQVNGEVATYLAYLAVKAQISKRSRRHRSGS